ncbi:MAG: GerMN domain-containing protein, partial [Defluviitaleaceae bacterium]|nr:GerMN domain-containing protein [Defluviitaleaceae bacterium]
PQFRTPDPGATATATAVLPATAAPADADTPTATPAGDATMQDYFPVVAGRVYSYESAAQPDANQDMVVDFTDGGAVQQFIKMGQYTFAQVLEFQTTRAMLVYGANNGCYEDFTGAKSNASQVVLQTPLQQGAKWTAADGMTCEVTNVHVSVSTPSGVYDCMEITSNVSAGVQGGQNDKVTVTYYAKGVGMVKTSYSFSDGTSYDLVLTKITDDSGITVPINVYLPGGNSEFIQRPYLVTTNYDLAATLTAAIVPGSDGKGLIAANAQVNSITIDRDSNTAALDLTDGFAGSNGKEDVLTCLAYTVGQFFQVDSVSFTVNGAQAGAEASYDGAPPQGTTNPLDDAINSVISGSGGN